MTPTAYVRAFSRSGGNLHRGVSSLAGLKYLPFNQGIVSSSLTWPIKGSLRIASHYAIKVKSALVIPKQEGEGRKSSHSDHYQSSRADSVKGRTPALQAGSWSSSLHQSIKKFHERRWSSLVKVLRCHRRDIGSNPIRRSKLFHVDVAQMAQRARRFQR